MSETSNENIIDKNIDSEEEFEAEQNWLGFWNLIIQEDMRQNPDYYKEIKEENNGDNRDTNNTD